MHERDINRVIDEELEDEGDEMIADDAKKGSIPKRLVDAAKHEERKFIEKMKVFDVVGRGTTNGKRVIRSRWVVTNKGSEDHPNVRARWVAQEFKSMDGPDHGRHYAGTPGLDMVKGVLGHAASMMDHSDVVVAVVDVRRAYFYAKPEENTFVELPDYFDAETRRTHCARLRRCLYGTRQAARAWQR